MIRIIRNSYNMQPGHLFKHDVFPAILENEWSEIEKKLEVIKDIAATVHIDFIDGKFVDNKTFLDPTPFHKYRNQFTLEAHLMVDDPGTYIKPLADAGFKRFIGHIEKMPDQVAFVADSQLVGEVGLAIDGKTPLENLRVPYDDLDILLVMMIDAGFSGQAFQESLLEKVKKVRSQSDIAIEVDGAISDKTLLLAKTAGANYFACSSFLFQSDDITQTLTNLQELARG